MGLESKIGVCSRCLVRDDDKTEKKLYRCSLCGEFFCRKHIQPKPCYVVNLGQPDKDPNKWRYLNDDGSGHPDADCQYDDYIIDIPQEGKTEEKPVEGTKTPEPPVTVPIEVKENRNNQLGTCPRCKCTDSDILKDYPHKAILKCWNCHLKYGQKKYPPYHYFHLRRHRPRLRRQDPRKLSHERTYRKERKLAKKTIIAGAIIVCLLTVIFFSGTLNTFVNRDFNPSPTSPDALSSVSQLTFSPIPQQNLLVNPKTIHYHYTLRGVSSEIAFTVYEGLYNYLVSSEDSSVSYYFGQQPSSKEINRIVTLRYVNEDSEKGELRNLVSAIQQITPNEDDQARIAISLVQNIPYDWNSLSTTSFDWKYPYEVLYSNIGVCSEKSRLLVCLLRELGYGCAIFDFSTANHQAVGIACPAQYDYSSGYAFIETTNPSIITDCSGEYVGVGKLPSSPDDVIVIQDGKAMNSVYEEYQDTQTYLSLLSMGQVLDQYHYEQWLTITKKYGLQVS
jgi:hypothetical protein